MIEDSSSHPFRLATTSALFYGVCAGFAYFAGFPVIFVRIACVLLFFPLFPISLLAYWGCRWLATEWDIEPDDFSETIGIN